MNTNLSIINKSLRSRIDEQSLSNYSGNKAYIIPEKEQAIQYRKKEIGNDNVYGIDNKNTKNGIPYDNIQSYYKTIQNRNFKTSPRKSLSNISSISNMQILNLHESEEAINNIKNGTKVMKDNFVQNCIENKENISHWTERPKVSSTKGGKYKIKQQSICCLKEKINVPNQCRLGIDIGSPLNADLNVKTGNKNEGSEISKILKKLNNPPKLFLADDINSILKRIKPEEKNIKALEEINQPENQLTINETQIGSREKIEEGSILNIQSFANERTQQGQSANFSIDISKIDGVNEISSLLSDEKNREWITSRFRNLNENENFNKAREIYKNIEKEFSDKKLSIKTQQESIQSENPLSKMTTKRSSKSNESAKNGENEQRKICYTNDGIISRIQNSKDNLLKSEDKGFSGKKDIISGSPLQNKTYFFMKQNYSSRSQNRQEDTQSEKIINNEQADYAKKCLSNEKNYTNTFETRISTKRMNSHSSQKSSDGELATSKSSYGNNSENGSVRKFCNPYDLIPPLANRSQISRNTKLNMNNANLINDLSEENAQLKMELLNERERVKRVEELSIAVTQMYQHIQATQVKYKKDMIEKGNRMAQQIKSLKSELDSLKNQNQQNFYSINEVLPHIARIFDYQRNQYTELQTKFLAILSENKVLKEHFKKN